MLSVELNKYKEKKMPQGTIKVFNKAKQNISGLLALSNGTDFSAILITTLPGVADLTPDSADYTECTVGGNYAGAVALTTTWLESAGTVTFDITAPDPIEWLAAAGSPTNIVSLLVYSETAAGEDALFFMDLTTDGGTTPVSMVDGKISITFPTAGFTLN